MSSSWAAQINFEYDANGNLIWDGETYRHYNSLNQLDAIYNGTDNTTLLAEFTHHPIEERVLMKKVYDAGVWKETYYYISDSFVSKKNSSGVYNATYVHLNGQLIAQFDFEGNKEFTHTDHLGSITALSDDSGNTIENTFYDPYGNIISGGKESQFDYTGKELQDTNDYDFDARQYNSEIGMFTSPDPIIKPYNPQALNAYLYALGNPYKYVDPDGKDAYLFLDRYSDAGAAGHTFVIVGEDSIGYTKFEGGPTNRRYDIVESLEIVSGQSELVVNAENVDLDRYKEDYEYVYYETDDQKTVNMLARGLTLEKETEETDIKYRFLRYNSLDVSHDILNANTPLTYTTPRLNTPVNYFRTEKEYSTSEGKITSRSIREKQRERAIRENFPDFWKEMYGS